MKGDGEDCGKAEEVGVRGGGVTVIGSEVRPDMSESTPRGVDNRSTFSSSRFFREGALGCGCLVGR